MCVRNETVLGNGNNRLFSLRSVDFVALKLACLLLLVPYYRPLVEAARARRTNPRSNATNASTSPADSQKEHSLELPASSDNSGTVPGGAPYRSQPLLTLERAVTFQHTYAHVCKGPTGAASSSAAEAPSADASGTQPFEVEG